MGLKHKNTKFGLVSIITPIYNRIETINETALSIFKQTYVNWEWVIIDDGSTDGTIERINELEKNDKRIKCYHRKNGLKGAATCRNIGVQKSNGDFLIFLDSDDILAEFCLEKRIEKITKNKECDFIAFQTMIFKEKINDVNLLWNINNDEDDINRFLKMDAPFCGTSTIWKKSSFIKIGLWNENLAIWQDIDLHLRAILSKFVYKKYLEEKPDVFLRTSLNSISRTGYYESDKMQSRINVLESAIIKLVANGTLVNYLKAIKGMYFLLVIETIHSRQYEKFALLNKIILKYFFISFQDLLKITTIIIINLFRLYKISIFSAIYKRISYSYNLNSPSLNKIKFVE
jgi:glycosyltransferase involved in cell wall biosynthesis